eukprot:scaffold183621_cov48-Prasinocladus_malaysianus.AAC.2
MDIRPKWGRRRQRCEWSRKQGAEAKVQHLGCNCLVQCLYRAEVLKDCEKQQQQLLEVHSNLTTEMKGLMEENDRLRAGMKAAMEEGRRRDELVLKNKELQSARYFDKISNTNKLRQQWHEHLLIMGEVSLPADPHRQSIQ